MKWVKASPGSLPEIGKKVFVEWQGLYDEHGEYQDREWIEEKMRDTTVTGIQWLDKNEVVETDQDILWDEFWRDLETVDWYEADSKMKTKYAITRK